MPLPFILWGAAAALAATGIYKGSKAKEMLEDAKRIGQRAEKHFSSVQSDLENDRETTNTALQALGKVKVDAFSNHIKHLVEAIKKGRSTISDFDGDISTEQLNEYDRMVQVSLNIESGIGTGVAAGALAAMGAYGTVGMLATASTGAAISGLTGAAATNATLAWLGGGALSAGGFGMAGGAMALGGIVLGPALAIGGFWLASEAEEALSEAHRYDAEVNEKVAKLQIAREGMKAIRTNAALLSNTIIELGQRYDSIKVNDTKDEQAFKRMCKLGKSIKEVLDISVMDKEGAAIIGLNAKLSGVKEVVGSLAG